MHRLTHSPRPALNAPVLVLNRLWQAIHICSVPRALGLVYRGRARVVREDDGAYEVFSFEEWCADTAGRHDNEPRLHSVTLCVRRPQVILLGTFDRLPRPEIRFSRHQVFVRDRFTCQYCRQRLDHALLNLDHVIPRHRGGETSWTNVVTSCHPCNHRKGNRTPEEAGMPLLRAPRKPRWHPFPELRHQPAVEPAWRHFLESTGWTPDALATHA